MFQAAPKIGGHARQLWRLNREGLLLTALNRKRERLRCPGDCYWPRSRALHGCWHLEAADSTRL